MPPPQEVEIIESAAWSCEHGLGRWTRDCGCRSPRLKDWSQAWRDPLRRALDWLSGELEAVYERNAGQYFKDYQRALSLYSERLRDLASPALADDFLSREALPSLPSEEKPRALSLLEMQRQRLAMFTSCGWFFDDVSGIETAQILKHAAKAISISETFGVDLSAPFHRLLSECPSNVPSWKDGAGVYARLALTARVNHRRIAAHHAILEHLSAGLGSCPPGWRLESGPAERARTLGLAGRDRALTALSVTATWLPTLEAQTFTAVVHQRDRLDFACRLGPPGFDAKGTLREAFESQDDADFEKTLQSALGAGFTGLDALLPEDRAEVLRWLTPDPVGGAKRRAFLDRWVAAMAALRSSGGGDEAIELLEQAGELKLSPDRLPWAAAARQGLVERLEELVVGADEAALARAGRWLEAFERGGMHVDLWELQYLFWRWRRGLLERGAGASERGLAAAFGEKLGFDETALALEATA